MTFAPENLGVSADGIAAAARLDPRAHGVSIYDNGRGELLTDRLAPLVVERGFRSFLDFYYLLKYDERAARRPSGAR